MPAQRRVRLWVGTLNNFTDADIEKVQNCDAIWVVYQREVGEEGTPHLQATFYWRNGVTMRSVKRKLGSDRWHLQAARGSAQQCREYCTKEDTRMSGFDPYERGDVPMQGARTDLAEVQEALDGGANIFDISAHFFPVFLRSHRAIDRYLDLRCKPRYGDTHVIVFYGDTGTGKSHRAHELFPGAFWLPEPRSEGAPIWFNGYHGQSTVVIDEFDPARWPYRFMLRLLDRFPLRVESKGGSTEFNSARVVITTNFNPRDWYLQAHEPLAIQRRLGRFGSGVIHLTERYTTYQTLESLYPKIYNQVLTT